jgi:hypothetical protein
VDETSIFHPPRRGGVIFHAVLVIVLATAGVWSLFQATRAEAGPVFFLYLLPALLALAGVPILVYRAYAVWRAWYALQREGIRLSWGLRAEDIPMDAVRWVGGVEQLGSPLRLPWLRWPGSVLGVRRLPQGERVEFMAARGDRLVVIATEGQLYAISPEDSEGFVRAFRRFNELGALFPLPARSVHPGFLLARVWSQPVARILLLAGLLLWLLLLAWVSFSIPGRETVALGFFPDGSPGEPAPSVRLFLLPVLNGMFLLVDILGGLFFFRRADIREAETNRALAYLLWGCGVLASVLFLLGVFFILT